MTKNRLNITKKISIFCFAILGIASLSGCDQNTSQTTETEITQSTVMQLTPPFNVDLIRENFGRKSGKLTCKAAPVPLHDLFFVSMYDKNSENSSIVDPDEYAAYKENTKPIKQLESGLGKYANHYVLSNPANSEIALCVLSWLKIWARDNALLGKSNHMGDFVRKWALSSISLSYIQIRHDSYISADDRLFIEDWIRQLGNRVIDDFSKDPDKTSRNNNHMYWAAWGVMTAGIALDDKDMFDWGIRSARIGINQIQPDGTLPLEVTRGSKAYNYHHYAAIPLFMIAHTADKNGIDLFNENNNGLKRMARLILENMDDQTYFENLTGEKQNLERTITRSNLSWLEPYYARYRDPDALKWLKKFRPVKHSRVGGDATLLYGSGLEESADTDTDPDSE